MTDLEKHETSYAMGYCNGIDRAIEVITDHCDCPDRHLAQAMEELNALKALAARTDGDK